MSLLQGKTQYERSAIPAAAQLELHVDAQDFLELATRPWPEEELLEQLAEAAHVVYCRGMLEQGYAWHEPGDDYLRSHPLLRRFAGARPRPRKTHRTLVAYERLDEAAKEQNREQVRDIPRKLDTVGYVLREARSGVSTGHDLELLPEDLERLAEEEHERWLWGKLRAGWLYGPKRSDAHRIHPALLPWRTLSDDERSAVYGSFARRLGPGGLSAPEKEKDVVTVRGIPTIAAAAGYEIVRVREPAVVVGVTGHGPVSDRRHLNAEVEKALHRIEQRFPGQPLEVISGLAEGADLGVARRVLAHPGARLVAILPLPREDYVATIELGGAKKELESLLGQADEVIELEPAAGAKAPYEAVDAYIVDHADVLITVADGDRNGGARRARKRGLPVASIGEQGAVRFERFEGAGA
jgi:RyR domain